MSRFNLLDEPWLSVVVDDKGSTKEVSLLDLFANAHQYKDLAGDTQTQDFAVLRVLLAVLHTVFSRFDADGNPYDYLEIDERFRQVERVEKEDIKKYKVVLRDTWINLWEQGQFSEIVSQYLEKWRDRFYLFDEEYPFFQVRKEDIEKVKRLKNGANKIEGMTINRLISESSNKAALFSPKQQDKNHLFEAEIARWLLTYHGYSETGPMDTVGEKPYSKGWLYNLGGLFLKGNNLYETLLMNLTLFYYDYNNHLYVQEPCWEFDSKTNIDNYINKKMFTNIASLYTLWSKEIYIDSDVNLTKFEFKVAKIPKISVADQFLEPMTLWKYSNDSYQPQCHDPNKSLWRSFGLITIRNKKSNHIPGIMDWQRKIKENIGNTVISVCSVGMVSDKTANNTPISEVFDTLSINELVLADLEEGGWVPRINDTVEETKKVISKTYKKYINDIKEIRNISSNLFTSQKVEELYFKIDQPFRQWLASIQPNDEKDAKVMDWRKTLKNLVEDEAKTLLSDGGNRDYTGIVEGKSVKNIATAYNEFSYWISQNLK
ncbi:type I-E CRISPR-associated protein Cse1/CasA [Streptococcus sobrinus]|uniref:type I-E CRISPR-associated protein Cse1/CasA n=1 Tax=Streptococcus sobrinus TaxID=1310 RepID=UPI0002ECA23F|nr:type I-E CRISPR-associated protein Cse1/CasA [Streptococcus sobrinus]